MVRLLLLFNNQVIKECPFLEDTATIGRKEDNTIVVDDLAVSSYHAKIERTESDYILTDLQSTNGTFVNEKKIFSQKLVHGDRLTIGNHVVLFVISEKGQAVAEENQTLLDRTIMLDAARQTVQRPRRQIRRTKAFNRRVEKEGLHKRRFPTLFAAITLAVVLWLILGDIPLSTKKYSSTTAPGIHKGEMKTASSPGQRGPEEVRETIGKAKPISSKPTQDPEAETPVQAFLKEEASRARSVERQESSAIKPQEPLIQNESMPARGIGESRFRLEAIVWSSNPRNRFAVINGRIVKAGGYIEGLSVTHIDKGYVAVQSGEKVWRLRLALEE